MELKDIKAIIDLMKKHSITEFELEKQEFKIKLRRGQTGAMALQGSEEMAHLMAPMAPLQVTGPAHLTPNTGLPPAPASSDHDDIKSPMIGTFYRSPSPEAGPFVEPGTHVEPDDVVCIIEAMKVMNEIKAEARGTITEILIENGKPVEFGQPLFRIKPAG